MLRAATAALLLASLVQDVARADPCSARFVRGDTNVDGTVNVSDPVLLLLELFGGVRQISCLDAADSNDDTLLSIGDAIYTLQFLFLSGSPPPAPWPDCGLDLTPAEPGCDEYALCTIPIAEEVCDGVDNNCDGRTDEGFDLSSVERCGACENDCRQLGWDNVAEYACEGGRCRIVRCEDGFFDLDGISFNGCETAQPPDGTPCDDGNPCTENDFFLFGICGGTPKNCGDLADPCNRGACDPSTGECYRVPRPGRPCDDGNPRTIDDHCDENGVCRGTDL